MKRANAKTEVVEGRNHDRLDIDEAIAITVGCISRPAPAAVPG